MRTPTAVFLSLSLTLAAACGGDDDAGSDAFPEVTEEGVWTWIPIEGNRCMDGSDTGIGVNLSRGSDKLLIVYEGGGACFNDLSCTGVAHQDGFGAEELAEFAEFDGAAGMVDRDDAGNPLADWNYAFIPYCTGDIHAGNNEDGIGGRLAVGYVNSTNALGRLADEFGGDLEQVLAAGISAGGFGVAYNYGQAVEAFGDTPVDLLDDSGPPPSATYFTPCLEEVVKTVWNLDATLPADCTACESGLGGLVSHWSQKYPERRQGYISSLRDDVIRQFFGFGYPSCENPQIPMDAEVYQAAIEELRDVTVAELPNAEMFTIDSNVHVWTVGTPLAEVVVGDSNLADWISGLVDHTDGWTTVAP